MLQLVRRALGLAGQETVRRRAMAQPRNALLQLERLEDRLVLDGPGGPGGGSGGGGVYTYLFTVNTLADTQCLNPGDGTGVDINGKVSLRSAIQECDAEGGSHEIDFSVTGTINLQSAMSTITCTVNIYGPEDADGNNLVTVAGSGSGNQLGLTYGIFTIGSASTTELQCLNLTGGNTTAGGAIVNLGDLTVFGCAMYDNTAGTGGAIYNGPAAELWLSSSYLWYNTASAAGGGIFNSIPANTDSGGASVAIVNSEIFCNSVTNDNGNGGGIYNGGTLSCSYNTQVYSNSAQGFGGGIYSVSTQQVTFSGGLINGNSASNGGGIYISGGTDSFSDVTINNNSASSKGGAAYLSGGTVTFDTCTIQGNTATYTGS